MANNKEKLFSDFPHVSTQEWMDKITVDLKGADFEKKLVWRTNEGFKVKPFYRQEDLEGLKTTEGLPGQFPFIRGNKANDNTWFIRQDIRVTDAAEANKKALDLLNRGVDSLGFHAEAKALSAEFIETLLKDICCDCIELNFQVVGVAACVVGLEDAISDGTLFRIFFCDLDLSHVFFFRNQSRAVQKIHAGIVQCYHN